MPQLRDMWPEYSDDDRFWIHPLGTHAEPPCRRKPSEAG